MRKNSKLLPSYNLERVWCCTALKGSNSVAVGYDEGTILIKMGRDEPAVTMDVNGKLIWARHSELCQGTIIQNYIFGQLRKTKCSGNINDIF